MSNNVNTMKKKINNFFNKLNKGKKWVPASQQKKEASADKLYEIYIYSIVASVLHSNKQITLIHKHLPNGIANPNTFVFRGSPSTLYKVFKKPKPAVSYLEIQKKGSSKVFDLHQSLEIAGISWLLHEMDICIVENRATNLSVNNRSDIRYFDVPITIECKYYKNKFKKGLSREVLGQALDTGRVKYSRWGMQDGFFIYFNENGKDSSIQELLGFHGLEALLIDPISKKSWERSTFQNLIGDFANRI